MVGLDEAMNPFELADYFGFMVAMVLGGLVVKAMKPRSPRPICTCSHGYGTHDNGGKCHGTEENERNFTDYIDPCPCQQYDGPDPLVFR